MVTRIFILKHYILLIKRIRQTLDEDVVDEIYDWFKTEATSDSLEEAMAALGGDYEEDEIRLVRIKFLSEVAN